MTNKKEQNWDIVDTWAVRTVYMWHDDKEKSNTTYHYSKKEADNENERLNNKIVKLGWLLTTYREWATRTLFTFASQFKYIATIVIPRTESVMSVKTIM